MLLTHLHADHVGWNTRKADGQWVPTFPNARYIFSARERPYGAALAAADGSDAAVPAEAGLGPATHPPMSGVYEDSVLPIVEAGLAREITVDGSEVAEGFRYLLSPGHSIDHAAIRFTSQGEQALFWGDVLHHPLQVRRPDWNSVYCEFPEAARRTRRWAMDHAAQTGALVFTTHFAEFSAGRLSHEGERFTWHFASGRSMHGTEFSIAGLVSECRMIPSDTAGIALQLINRRPDGIREFTADRTLVMMHGATFPSASLFDVPVYGESFMDALARAGYDVWAVDARGYGGSTRPPEMSGPPEGVSPLTPARTAVRDLRAAVDFVRRHRGVAQVNLLGMSWGTTVSGAFAADSAEEIAKLVLVTPLWLSRTKLRIDPGGQLGAYRVVSPKAFETGWRIAAPEPKRQALIPAGWFEAGEQMTLATDPGALTAETIRAPAGAVQDVRDHWTADNPLYDPSAVRCPVLVIAAEWDIDVPIDMARDLFVRLTSARYKRLIEIGEGTHMVLMEKNRHQAFDAMIGFLDERFEPAV